MSPGDAVPSAVVFAAAVQIVMLGVSDVGPFCVILGPILSGSVYVVVPGFTRIV